MKFRIRITAFVLSLLLALSMPVAALAEEGTVEVPVMAAELVPEPTPEPTAEPTAEPTVEPTAEPTTEPTAEPTAVPTAEPTAVPTVVPTPEPTAVPTVVPTPEPTAEPTAVPTVVPTPEPTAEPTEEPTAEPAPELELEMMLSAAPPVIDTTKSAAENPAFTCGYAELAADAAGYADAADGFVCLRLGRGTVYANERSAAEPDRMHIWFEDAGSIRDCWVDAVQLRPMSEEEIQAFAAGGANLFYENNAALPLAVLECREIYPEMQLAADKLVLGLKEQGRIYVSFSDGKAHGVSYSSANSRYCSVTADGVVTSHRARTIAITVTSEFGHTAVVQVQGKKAPYRITVSPSKARICQGDTLQLGVTLNSGAASAISWTSSNPAVASVDANGAVTALAAGEAKITARTFNGRTGSATVSVVPAPAAIAFSETEAWMGVGETRVFTSAASPVDAGSRSYSTDRSDLLQVDAATGSVTAVAPGTAKLFVKSYNGQTGSCTVTIKAAPSCITLSQSSITIGLGETVNLPEVQVGAPGEDCAGGYSLKSSNSRYLTIVDGTKIKANRARTTTITVSTYNGKTATLTVNVKRAPSRLTMSPTSLVLGVGESRTVLAKPNANTAGTITYSSSNEAVARVNAATGEVTAVGMGSAVITGRSFNGRTAKCSVTVLAAPSAVSLSAAQLNLGVGEVYTLKYALSSGSAGHCSFASDNPAVAEVDAATGKVRAAGFGTATLYARTYNGKTAQCSVTVKNAPTGIDLRETNITLALGDSYQLQPPTVHGENAGASAFAYKSAVSRYVSVSADGLITAHRARKTVRITVSTYNGKTDSVNVTVQPAVTGIAFEESSRRMFVGGTWQPAVKTNVSCSYRLTSSNPAVACIAADGRTIQALSGGTATITATTYNGKTATLNLTVPGLPTSIALQPAAITRGEGETFRLQAVMPSGQDSLITWTSSNPAVAGVAEDGTISCKQSGSAAITAKTMNGLTATCNVRVAKAPTDVILTPANAMRSIDEKQLQLGIAFGTEGQGGSYEITSSNPAVASVGYGGLVSFHSVGSTRITIRTYNGHSAACDLTIGEKPGKMFFGQPSYSIAVGDTAILDARFDKGCESYTASIADTSVATASKDAVTGVAVGSTTMNAVSYSGLKAACTLNVVAAPSGIALDRSEMTITFGVSGERSLTANVQPHGVGSVRFTSSNPAVATVDALTGEMTPVSTGDCIITATTYNGHSAQCRVKVDGILSGVKIGIDPGHQAKANRTQEAVAPGSKVHKDSVSSGAAGKSTRIPEHVTNLQIGLKLRDALEALGAQVYMTRTSADVDISNQQRAKMMNELGVDVVLRVHGNSSTSSSRQGMSIYVRATGACKAESAEYARLILHYMQAETGAKNLGVKYSDTYTGLNWSTVPSMLMELGYLSNYTEDKLLNSPDYQDKLVRGMVYGICDYLDRPMPDYYGTNQ